MPENEKTKTKNEETNEPRITPAKKTIRHPDFRSLYLNHLQIGNTRWDFQLVLGIVEISKAEEYEDVVQELECVKMTPAYAKALTLDLLATIKRYEEMYGEIPMPQPLDQPLNKPE